MAKVFIVFSFICFPVLCFCQSGNYDDSTVERIKKDVCDDRIFVSVEVDADFKNGQPAFEDTLTTYLKGHNQSIGRGEAKFRLLVTKFGQVLEVEKTDGSLSNEAAITKVLFSIPDMWIPAKQNGRAVCDWTKIDITISHKKLHVSRANRKVY